jgi:hypothetical protein
MVMSVLQFLYVGPLGVGLALFAISVVYFVAGRHQPTAKRVLKSSHGIVFFCTMYPIVARDFSVFSYAGWLSYPFWIFVVLGILSTAYSLYGYTRRWPLHFLHLFTLLYGSLATLYGMHALPHASL